MINLEDMLNASVHLGHPIKQWNPKMAPFIYGERNGIHLIDIVQTMICLAKVKNFLLNAAKNNKTCESIKIILLSLHNINTILEEIKTLKFLFVGTKKQFNSIIKSEI